ncbi:MAG: UbiX family flavin prenyltransferase [Desulfobulbaceae bacterium]|nr:UbiX family flavin prenyltransferase [Desulfobulbaceae bacterium]
MNLILAVTGASGAYAAKSLMKKSPWPVSLVASDWGKDVYQRECASFDDLAADSVSVFSNDDLAAAIASGSVPTVGMVVLPCSTNTLADVATGSADTLITRAAHCHLKEGKKLVLCVRETPWTAIDFGNAEKVALAGATVMPLSPPFYMTTGRSPDEVTMSELMDLFVDRILSLLGHTPEKTWETYS